MATDNGWLSASDFSKREYFAGLAMQGLMTRTHTGNEDWASNTAATSLEAADALLAELAKEPGK